MRRLRLFVADDDERVNEEGTGTRQDEDEVEKKEKDRQCVLRNFYLTNTFMKHWAYRARAALWADFQASVGSSSKTSDDADATPRTKKLVKIEKRHRFAGEEVV